MGKAAEKLDAITARITADIAQLVKAAVDEAVAVKLSTPQEPEYISLKECAELIGKSTRSVKTYVEDEDHPLPCKQSGRRLRFKRDDVVRWMDRKR